MNAKDLQKSLLKHLSKRPDFFVLTTNLSWLLPFEADVFQITKNRLIIEYEIKISRGDFLKDCKKEKKLYRLPSILKYDYLLGKSKFKNEYFQNKRPHKFYYVCPFDLIKANEIPKGFGLIYIYDSGKINIVKKATKLHNDSKASDSLAFDVARNFCLKKCND